MEIESYSLLKLTNIDGNWRNPSSAANAGRFMKTECTQKAQEAVLGDNTGRETHEDMREHPLARKKLHFGSTKPLDDVVKQWNHNKGVGPDRSLGTPIVHRECLHTV